MNWRIERFKKAEIKLQTAEQNKKACIAQVSNEVGACYNNLTRAISDVAWSKRDLRDAEALLTEEDWEIILKIK